MHGVPFAHEALQAVQALVYARRHHPLYPQELPWVLLTTRQMPRLGHPSRLLSVCQVVPWLARFALLVASGGIRPGGLEVLGRVSAHATAESLLA